MNVVPIAFAFDNNWVIPACICISSLMMNADSDTFYEIFILHSSENPLDRDMLDKIQEHYENCRIQYRTVDGSFDHSYEVRNVTVSSYYRLLIPEIIPEYDKILYSDADVIFRSDLSNLYETVEFGNCLVAGVNSLSHLVPDVKEYYEKQLSLDADKIIYAGNIMMNAKAMREENIVDIFKSMASDRYRFQDMDILNVVCSGRIVYLPPKYCITTYISQFATHELERLTDIWTVDEINGIAGEGIIHYNGQKPWKGYCVNFDIWWEYYRKSPFFDPEFYFDFFYDRLNELDQLSLWKRIKILLRYFVYGRRKI